MPDRPATRTARRVSRQMSRRDSLEQIIRQRISTRLGHRIRNLVVGVEGGVIHLAGQCSTYYSKQLAQHAVLGVVENEIVENGIEVAVPPPRE